MFPMYVVRPFETLHEGTVLMDTSEGASHCPPVLQSLTQVC